MCADFAPPPEHEARGLVDDVVAFNHFLDQSALLDLLGELKLTDVTDRIRAATERLSPSASETLTAPLATRT